MMQFGGHWSTIEKAPLPELTALQEERLAELVRFAAQNSRYYGPRLKEAAISSETFKRGDLSRLPPTPSSDLMQDPFIFQSRNTRIVSVTCSGGTTHRPKLIFRTTGDLDTSIDYCARAFACSGMTPDDTVMILQPFGLWIIGTLAYEACRKIGARTIPMGDSIPEYFMLEFLMRFKPSIIFTSPNFGLHLTSALLAQGVDLKSLQVRSFLLAGERLMPQQREHLQAQWGANCRNIYGTDEVGAVGAECQYGTMHFWLDHFICEVIDPTTRQEAPAGEAGALLITPLLQRGQPLLRYMVGDLAAINHSPCPCGCSHPGITILGRNSASISLRDATKIYAYQIDAVFQQFPPVEMYQVLHRLTNEEKDWLVFRIVLSRDSAYPFEEIQQQLIAQLQNLFIDVAALIRDGNLDITVEHCEHSGLVRSMRGKVVPFVTDHSCL